MPYPPVIAEALRTELGLDGTGRLLDVGCGPGSLTVLLAPLFESAVGIDADGDMVAEAARNATVHGVANVDWRHLRAEDISRAELGAFRTVTFAQSFHWMDQPLVARRVRDMLTPDGAWVHVFATTHRGVDGDDPLPYPRPPWARIDKLVAAYLGDLRRAGQGVLPNGPRSGEEDVMRAAGYGGRTQIDVSAGDVAERTTDEIVAAVFSLSNSAPHLFGARLAAFEADLCDVLRDVSPDGRFAERRRDIALIIWRL
jgi:hypothetical protein